jgi:hypothetical protein
MAEHSSVSTSSKIGVSVFTWGSQQGAFTLKNNYLFETVDTLNKVFLQSHNPGHAAILVTVKDSEAARTEIQSLLEGTGIPYGLKKYEQPVLDAGHKFAYTEDVIEVYFSFWPSDVEGDFAHFSTYESDLSSERSGVPVLFNTERMHQLNSALQPEIRTMRARQATHFFQQTEKEIDLGFKSHFHMTPNAKLNDFVMAYQKKSHLEDMLEAVKIGLSKVTEVKSKFSESDKIQRNKKESIPSMLKNLIPQLIATDELNQISTLLQSGKANFLELKCISKILERKKNAIKQNVKWARVDLVKIADEYLDSVSMMSRTDAIEKLKKMVNLTDQDRILLDFVSRYYKEFNSDILDLDWLSEKLIVLQQELESWVSIGVLDEVQDEINALASSITDCLNGIVSQEFDEKMMVEIKKSLLKCLKKTLNEVSDQIDDINDEMINELTRGSYFVGRQPDHTLLVPIKTAFIDGLDAMAMIKEMANIAKEKKEFDLITHNCSSTSARVLKSGAGEKGWIFDQGEWGAFFTPHIVHMRAREFLNQLNKSIYEPPKTSFFMYQRGLSFFGGRTVSAASQLYAGGKHPIKKAVLCVDAFVSGATATALETAGDISFKIKDTLKRKYEAYVDGESSDVELPKEKKQRF